MRVLYLHQYFTTPRGASGTRSYEFAQRLLARGHHVTMVCGTNALSQTGLTNAPAQGVRRGEVDGIDVIELCLPYSNYDGLFKRSRSFMSYASRSAGVIVREPYDLLFATLTPLTIGIPGIMARLLKPRAKFVFEVRDLWPELPRATGVVTNPQLLATLSMLERTTYAAMHAGVALSPGIEIGIRRRTSSTKPIAMIPNGCDLAFFGGRCGCASNDANLPRGYPTMGLRCVFTGAHGIANGLEAVLDAATVLLCRGRNDIHLIMIGDGKLKPRLQSRAQRDGLVNCLFYDPLPKQQLAYVMTHVEAGLMILANVPAFYYGTSPNKFFDYIAARLPVVNNYPGWLADLIGANHCGLAEPPQNPEAFADALIDLADYPDRRSEMGRNARALAEREFDRDKLGAQFVTFLETTVAKTTQP